MDLQLNDLTISFGPYDLYLLIAQQTIKSFDFIFNQI